MDGVYATIVQNDPEMAAAPKCVLSHVRVRAHAPVPDPGLTPCVALRALVRPCRRFVMAAATSDSTTVYYRLHKGIVPPPEDKFGLKGGHDAGGDAGKDDDE